LCILLWSKFFCRLSRMLIYPGFWFAFVACIIIRLFVSPANNIWFSFMFLTNISINTTSSQTTRPLYTFQFCAADISTERKSELMQQKPRWWLLMQCSGIMFHNRFFERWQLYLQSYILLSALRVWEWWSLRSHTRAFMVSPQLLMLSNGNQKFIIGLLNGEFKECGVSSYMYISQRIPSQSMTSFRSVCLHFF
jgi:hypothetical protein